MKTLANKKLYSGPEKQVGMKDEFQTQKMYVRNISNNISTEQWQMMLYSHFSEYGQILDLKVLLSGKLKSKKR